MSELRKVDATLTDGGRFDAAGRMRVSNTLVLGEYSNVEGKNTDLFDFQGTGSHTYEDLTDDVVGVKLAVTPGQWVVAESVYAHGYIKGHSHKFDTTTQNFVIEAGIVKRMGLFSSNTTTPFDADFDGMYIESDGITDNDYFIVLTRKGTIVARLSRTNDWLDPLDGTGKSGVNIDWTNFDIVENDFLWYGGKGCRTWIMANNNPIQIVEYGHAGLTKGLIMRNPNQPIRYEIRSTTGTGYFYLICAGVVSEGSKNTIGLPRLVQDRDSVRANDIGVSYLISAVRLKQSKRNTIVTIEDFGVASTTSDSYTFRIVKNPLIAGVDANTALVWNEYSTVSAIEYATIDITSNPSIQTVTGGQEWRGANVDSRAPSGQGSSASTLNQLSRRIDGTSDVLCLVATPNSSGARLTGSINLNENTL